MIKYHKIQTMFLRDPDSKHKYVMVGEWAKPEFRYLQDNDWYIDEKIDGTNIRIMWDGYDAKIGGKTDAAQLPIDLVHNILGLIDEKKFGEVFGTKSTMLLQEPLQVCLYGEGYGPGIQKGGGNYRKDKSFILFDININGKWLERDDVERIGIELGFDLVPQVGIMNLKDAMIFCQRGFNSEFGDFKAEGIIARPLVPLTNKFGERVITKLKCSDFPPLG